MIRRAFAAASAVPKFCVSESGKRQRANQPWAVAPPLRNYPLYQIFLNLGNFNLSRM